MGKVESENLGSLSIELRNPLAAWRKLNEGLALGLFTDWYPEYLDVDSLRAEFNSVEEYEAAKTHVGEFLLRPLL
jgi:uncharacterized protein (DUF2249 family)